VKYISPPQFYSPLTTTKIQAGEITMTIRLPPDNFLDSILAIFGKKRKIIMPENSNQIEQQLGPYVTIQARKEGFFKALFRHQS